MSNAALTELHSEVRDEAREISAYDQWLAREIQAAIEDPRPSVPHEEIMARMDERIARHKATESVPQ